MQEFSKEWFDLSSKAWRENKKKCGGGFKYVCEHIKKTGKMCRKNVDTKFLVQHSDRLLCKYHLNRIQSTGYEFD